jgi:hypothetical protein
VRQGGGLNIAKGITSMKSSKKMSHSQIADIVESRSPAGRSDAVQGWHNLLKNLLKQMAPYLREGQMVTFRKLKEQESSLFQRLHQKVTVPTTVGSIYLPPSVLFQMLYQRPEGKPQTVPEYSLENPPDEGIVLACRTSDVNVVVNALLAKPPYAPAIDVYDDGQLLAGYIYNTIDECIANLETVMHTHLQPGHHRE